MIQPTREEALAHFGVVGMKWGVRKQAPATSTQSEKRMSAKKKVAIGVGVVAITGAAAAAIILGKQGKLPVKDIAAKLSTKRSQPVERFPYSGTTDRGAKAAKQLSNTDVFKKLLKDMEADMADAHKEETNWMRKNVPNYNPHSDPYIPRAELQRVNNR